MKYLIVAGAIVALQIYASESLGQKIPVPTEKNLQRTMFAAVPARVSYPSTELNKIFSLHINDDVSIRLNDQFVFTGTIIDKVERKSGTVSLNIRSVNYPGALFTVSSVNIPGEKTVFTGRILHPGYGDVLELIQENDQYYLRKKNQNKMMVE
jgi:hypothetical protein